MTASPRNFMFSSFMIQHLSIWERSSRKKIVLITNVFIMYIPTPSTNHRIKIKKKKKKKKKRKKKKEKTKNKWNKQKRTSFPVEDRENRLWNERKENDMSERESEREWERNAIEKEQTIAARGMVGSSQWIWLSFRAQRAKVNSTPSLLFKTLYWIKINIKNTELFVLITFL